MFPLRDNVPSRSFPIVNLGLIAANAAVFFFELSLSPSGLEALVREYGLVPIRYAHGLSQADSWLPFLSSQFLHGGWAHVLSNLWILYIFGDNVEDRLGHLRFLLFYLLSGISAAMAQLLASWGSSVPMIGASGAIAGVMGAYFILFPRARVLTLVPIFIFLQTVEVPAFLFLLLWLWSQFYAGSLALSGSQAGGVAWWAHIGGFIGGISLLGLVLPKGRRR
ncbi:MAG: rhomboid family intramembrane serine protease [Elusimicrobia bacterium]|nr:rhomboid family intramembrane serine protease [Elusimicrobiota bacterium]